MFPALFVVHSSPAQLKDLLVFRLNGFASRHSLLSFFLTAAGMTTSQKYQNPKLAGTSPVQSRISACCVVYLITIIECHIMCSLSTPAGHSDTEWLTPALSEKFQSRFGWRPNTADSGDMGLGTSEGENAESVQILSTWLSENSSAPSS